MRLKPGAVLTLSRKLTAFGSSRRPQPWHPSPQSISEPEEGRTPTILNVTVLTN